MYHTIDPVPCKTPAAFAWLPATRLDRDVLDKLAEALGPMWSVHRETDSNGETSIVVLADDDGLAFLLYEKGGLVRVGTVSGDEWTNDEGFFGIQAAIDAIIPRTVPIATAGPTGSERATPAAARTAVE